MRSNQISHDDQPFVLSVCVPTYNREAELANFFVSCDPKWSKLLEIVIVDDGSTDGTSDLCNRMSERLSVNYTFQENRGRAAALANAIQNANGRYLCVMDSDDWFSETGLQTIFSQIFSFDQLSDDIIGFIFLCETEKGKVIGSQFTDISSVNLLALRADKNCLGDKKEVIRSDVLKACLSDVFFENARVPTSLLWFRSAKFGKVLPCNSIVAVKTYLPGGMTDTNISLKVRSSGGTCAYYKEVVLLYGERYVSLRFLFRNSVNLVRFILHDGWRRHIYRWPRDLKPVVLLVVGICIPLGLILFIQDKALSK